MQHHLRRGGNSIEFALTAPLLLLLVYGSLEYGYCIYLQATLDHASAIGARAGALTPQEENATAVAERSALDTWQGVGGGNMPVFTAQVTGAPPNQVVKVTGELSAPSLAGLPVFPLPRKLCASAQLGREDQ